MDQEDGNYCTINDGLLNGYKGNVYGIDETGSKKDYSYTMQKVIIENGKVVSTTGELRGLPIIANLSDGSNENNDKVITKTDIKTNIKLEADKGIITDDTIMEITEISSGTTFDKIKNSLEEIKNFKAFDITLKSNNTNIQPKGNVKISIPVPVGFDASRLLIYRFEEDGTKIEYQVKVANGYATFETDHFSTYVLGEKTEVSNENQNKTGENVGETNNTKLPQTGEGTNTFVTWLSIVILVGIFWLGSMLLIDREKKKMTPK